MLAKGLPANPQGGQQDLLDTLSVAAADAPLQAARPKADLRIGREAVMSEASGPSNGKTRHLTQQAEAVL